MKQLVQNEFNKDEITYSNISSPASQGTNKQVESFVEENGKLKYVVEGQKKSVGVEVIDNLTTPNKEEPLSANQGVELKKLVDELDTNKLEVFRYATNTPNITQEIARDIIANYGNYEGKIIEFLSNGDAPYKTFAYGYVMANGNGDQFLVVLNNDGTSVQWNKSTYDINFIKFKMNVGLCDIDNLTIDNEGEPAIYVAGLESAINKPEGTGINGAVLVMPYNFNNQIQLYIDTTTGRLYTRVITGTDNKHSFSTFKEFALKEDIVIPEVPDASISKKGIIQIATESEASVGTDTTKAITPAILKKELSKFGTVFDFKGNKASKNELPLTNNKKGDVWFVVDESVGYIWLKDTPDGTIDDWEQFGKSIDLTNYLQKSDVVNSLVGTDTDKPLSAYQGNVLYGLLADKISTQYFNENKGTRVTVGGVVQSNFNADNKVDKVNGKGLSTNDFTNGERTKLEGIEEGANKIVEYLVNAVVSGETLTITKADGSTVTFKGGGGVPTNMVTTDTEQTISGNKTFTGTILVPNVTLP